MFDDFDTQLQCEEMEGSDHCLLCGDTLGNCLCYDIETSTNLPPFDEDNFPF